MRTLAQIAKEDKAIAKLFFMNPLYKNKCGKPEIAKKPISYIGKRHKKPRTSKMIGEV